MRTAVLVAALIFTGSFGVLTLYVIVRTGLDVLTAASLGVLALFVFGIFGALSEKR